MCNKTWKQKENNLIVFNMYYEVKSFSEFLEKWG